MSESMAKNGGRNDTVSVPAASAQSQVGSGSNQDFWGLKSNDRNLVPPPVGHQGPGLYGNHDGARGDNYNVRQGFWAVCKIRCLSF